MGIGERADLSDCANGKIARIWRKFKVRRAT